MINHITCQTATHTCTKFQRSALTLVTHKSSPNIYELIGVFKREQAASDLPTARDWSHSSTMEEEAETTGAEGSAERQKDKF